MRIDLTDEMLSKGIAFQPRDPGAPILGNPGLLVMTALGIAENNPAIEVSVARRRAKTGKNNFLKGDNPGVVMTFCRDSLLIG